MCILLEKIVWLSWVGIIYEMKRYLKDICVYLETEFWQTIQHQSIEEQTQSIYVFGKMGNLDIM